MAGRAKGKTRRLVFVGFARNVSKGHSALKRPTQRMERSGAWRGRRRTELVHKVRSDSLGTVQSAKTAIVYLTDAAFYMAATERPPPSCIKWAQTFTTFADAITASSYGSRRYDGCGGIDEPSPSACGLPGQARATDRPATTGQPIRNDQSHMGGVCFAP